MLQYNIILMVNLFDILVIVDPRVFTACKDVDSTGLMDKIERKMNFHILQKEVIVWESS